MKLDVIDAFGETHKFAIADRATWNKGPAAEAAVGAVCRRRSRCPDTRVITTCWAEVAARYHAFLQYLGVSATANQSPDDPLSGSRPLVATAVARRSAAAVVTGAIRTPSMPSPS